MLTRIYRQANRALRVHGVLGSIRIALEKARCSHVYHDGPSLYDREHGVVTDGNEDTRQGLYTVRYQPTAESIVREMIESIDGGNIRSHMANAKPGDVINVLPGFIGGVPMGAYTFIDAGSGKGRVLLVASEYPFRAVIGVEYDDAMNNIALANIRTYQSPTQRCRDIKALCADATQFPFPPQPTVLFLANPFNGPVMRDFIANVESSLRAHPRPFYVLYRQAKEAAMWDASPAFRRIATTAMYVCYRAS